MGAWQEIVDYTVPSNTTSVTLNNFGTITKDDFVKVVATFTTTVGTEITIHPNNDSTTTNYWRQILLGNGTSVTAGRTNTNQFASFSSATTQFFLGYIKLSENDKFNLFLNRDSSITSSLMNIFHYLTSTSSFSSGITSLTFTSTLANGIGTGSRIQIYKLAAEKVADITVASNTTQVDISNLSIDKDSEYLLVGERLSPTGGGDFWLTPNDLTTNSNYYYQYIYGEGTSATANRGNSPRVGSGGTGGNSIHYMHIKLSNIGAFTTQSYEMFAYGTSTVQLLNWFISSTYENLTSITKLNIRSEGTNGILAGSRYQLYKLY